MYKSQVTVIERALETAGLMLGTNKSRGYCLEMICADFLAGANWESGNPDVLLLALDRLYTMLPSPQKENSQIVSKERRELPSARTAQVSIKPGLVQRTLPSSTRARRLAMPEVRQLKQPAAPPYLLSKFTWSRCRGKLDYCLCGMPPKHSRP